LGLIPLKTEGESIISLFEEKTLSLLGLKKFDFLSLRETLGLIKNVSKKLCIKLPNYSEINLEDEKT
jgi:DNA polymerase III alpha subunit